MESKKNKLLHNLKNNGADKIYDAYNWLQKHRSELNKEVYGPVLLEVLIIVSCIWKSTPSSGWCPLICVSLAYPGQYFQ